MAQAIGLETTARARPAVRVTFEQFLELAGEPSHSEWVDGQVIILSPSSDLHQEIVELLLFLLKPIVQRHGLGRVHVAPFLMRLPGLDRAREPDLLFVRQDRLHLSTGTGSRWSFTGSARAEGTRRHPSPETGVSRHRPGGRGNLSSGQRYGRRHARPGQAYILP